MNTAIKEYNITATVYAPKGIHNSDKEYLHNNEDVMYYFTDGCTYSIEVSKDEEYGYIVFYGDGFNAGNHKEFKEKGKALHWAKLHAEDVLLNGYN
jgi:hypothetical protein